MCVAQAGGPKGPRGSGYDKPSYSGPSGKPYEYSQPAPYSPDYGKGNYDDGYGKSYNDGYGKKYEDGYKSYATSYDTGYGSMTKYDNKDYNKDYCCAEETPYFYQLASGTQLIEDGGHQTISGLSYAFTPKKDYVYRIFCQMGVFLQCPDNGKKKKNFSFQRKLLSGDDDCDGVEWVEVAVYVDDDSKGAASQEIVPLKDWDFAVSHVSFEWIGELEHKPVEVQCRAERAPDFRGKKKGGDDHSNVYIESGSAITIQGFKKKSL